MSNNSIRVGKFDHSEQNYVKIASSKLVIFSLFPGGVDDIFDRKCGQVKSIRD